MLVNRIIGLLIFTVVEVVTLVVWLILAGLPFHSGAHPVLAIVVLFIGIFIEHYISVNVARKRILGDVEFGGPQVKGGS